MRCSLVEALDILSRWENSKSSVDVIFDGVGFSGTLHGDIRRRPNGEFVVSARNADDAFSGLVRFRLNERVECSYGEPSELTSAEDRDEAGAAITSGLRFVFGPAGRVFLYEVV